MYIYIRTHSYHYSSIKTIPLIVQNMLCNCEWGEDMIHKKSFLLGGGSCCERKTENSLNYCRNVSMSWLLHTGFFVFTQSIQFLIWVLNSLGSTAPTYFSARCASEKMLIGMQLNTLWHCLVSHAPWDTHVG